MSHAQQRSALSLVAQNSMNRADAPNRAGARKPDAPLAKQSEQAGKCRAAARSAPAPLPFTRHTGLQMVVSVDKCPVYKSSANGRPAATLKAGVLKSGTEIHVLEELADSKCTWLRCQQGWLPMIDGSGKRVLRVMDETGALATPSGREVVEEREGSVQAVMETLHSRDSEMSTAWSTTSAAGDELVLTYVTKGKLGFDLDTSYSRVVAIDADARAAISSDLQIGVRLRAVQGTEVAGLSKTQMRKLWSSVSHLRPLALSFTLNTSCPPAASLTHTTDETSSNDSSDRYCCSSDVDSVKLRRIGGKIAELSAASKTQVCAQAAEVAMKEEMANSKLDSKRWTQLSSLLANVGWIDWSTASSLGIDGGANLVGKRVVVLGEGFGTVQSYEAGKRFGSCGVHQISFENRCSVKPVKLEKKNGSKWLLFNPLESPHDWCESELPQAPPPTPIQTSQASMSDDFLSLSPAADSKAGATVMLEPEHESTPKGPDLAPQTPSSTFKITLD